MASKASGRMTGFQKLIGISILIFALAFAYYLIIYIPGQAKTKQQLDSQREALRQTSLNSCLIAAETDYHATWNTNCTGRGLKLDCALPLALSESVNNGFKQDQDNCYKRYPAP